MSSFPNPSRTVLLVEDNDDDVEITRLAFKQADPAVRICHVPDGEECMRFLQRAGHHADAPLVDLMLLDLNMPCMDGREVLEAVSVDSALRHLPIVVMTSSTAERDVLDAYFLGCNSYIVKPIEFDRFVVVIRCIIDYWLSIVLLPTRVSRSAVPALELPSRELHGGSPRRA